MPTYNVLEAKTQLSKLLDAVESGAETEIIIARNGKPAAMLVPMPARPPIRLGLAKGKLDGLVALLDDPEVEATMEEAWEEFWNEDITTGEDIIPLEELRAKQAERRRK
jgi:prevent-host-death family protein